MGTNGLLMLGGYSKAVSMCNPRDSDTGLLLILMASAIPGVVALFSLGACLTGASAVLLWECYFLTRELELYH